jgi:hypothetical protein
MFKIVLDIVIGALLIVIASFIPGPAPTGLFWPALLVAIPSIVIGRYGKIGFRWFSLGVVFGGVIVVLVKFSQWGELGPMLAILQIVPVFASIVSFLFGWVLFAPTRARNKRATSQ